MDGRHRRQRRLPADLTSVGLARAELRHLLADVGEDAWLDPAMLALSELVTNALVHTGSEVGLDLWVEGDRLRIEVADDSSRLPAPRDFSPLAGTGRGLHIVDGLVDAWGVARRETGKVVWFEVWSAATTASLLVACDDSSGSLPRRDAVQVELRNFPLMLHAAWQEQASALLRERLLIGHELDVDTLLAAHACASDAMNLLFQQVPAPPALEHPQQIMVSAIEPHVSLDLLLIEVPPASVAHFESLDVMLEEATDIAAAGDLLASPAQPEVRAFRRWVCAEVRRQATRGAAPVPWSSTLRPHPRRGDDNLAWDPTPVNGSPRALIAASDTGHVVAVSVSALALLGYPDADGLCGQRLLRIVPTRYHQAHIAGLTQHVMNGRRPLLGTPVTVPVVRADGSEAEVDLLVEAHPLPDGRRVFVAELSPPGSGVHS